MQRQASVVIFGGTSEGRELAEYAESHRIPVLVSVVSGYGESLLRESDMVRVHTGALDETAMRQFLQETAPKTGIRCDASLRPGGDGTGGRPVPGTGRSVSACFKRFRTDRFRRNREGSFKNGSGICSRFFT